MCGNWYLSMPSNMLKYIKPDRRSAQINHNPFKNNMKRWNCLANHWCKWRKGGTEIGIETYFSTLTLIMRESKKLHIQFIIKCETTIDPSLFKSYWWLTTSKALWGPEKPCSHLVYHHGLEIHHQGIREHCTVFKAQVCWNEP